MDEYQTYKSFFSRGSIWTFLFEILMLIINWINYLLPWAKVLPFSAPNIDLVNFICCTNISDLNEDLHIE